MTGAGSNHVTDVGFDTQYEFLGARDSFSLQARYILEYQDLSASQLLGLSTNSFNSLHSFHIKGTYYYKQMIGLTAGYFNLQGEQRLASLWRRFSQQQSKFSRLDLRT